MRWFIEISHLAPSDVPKQKLCIEAAGWQPALKDVRAIRGEEGPLSGFSIELLDDGARAVDPVSKLRYVIREAPADAPITHTKSGPVTAEAKTEVSKASPAKEPAAPVPAPKQPSPEPAKPAPTPAKPTVSEPQKTSAPAAATAMAEPTIESAKALGGADESDEVDVAVDEDAPDTEAAASLPSFSTLHSREEDPSAASPITYREHVYIVDPKTTDQDIERLIRVRFEAIRQSLSNAKTGRYVNLAVFDQAFAGKPTERPRATLMWKDWRGTPEVRFPAAERASLSPPSFAAPTSLSDNVPRPSIEPPPTSQSKSTQPESSAPATTQQTVSASAPSTTSSPAPATIPAASTTLPVASGSLPAASTTLPAAAGTLPAASTTLPVVSATVPPTEPVPTALAKTERAPAPVISEKPGEWAPLEKSKPAAKSDKSTTGERPSLPVSSIPKTKPAAVSAPLEAYIAPAKLGKDAAKRKSGDDLISDLFEACGDLQFLRDSLEGADFVATIALEKMPSELCLVSLFDINRRELVVVRQAGGPKSIVLKRLSERAGVVTAAMRKRAAIVIPDAKKDPRAVDERYQQLGLEPKSMIVAPVEQSGRYLGIIELVNPADGKPFTEAEGHALTYIGEQYAELVANHGIQIEPDLVIERHQRR